MNEINSSKNKKTKLENLTSLFDLTKLMLKWYQHFNPEKANLEFIEEKREEYQFCDDVLVNTMYRSYVDNTYPRYQQQLWLQDPPCPRPRQ